jgi:hypothetical protein
LNEEAVAQNW